MCERVDKPLELIAIMLGQWPARISGCAGKCQFAPRNPMLRPQLNVFRETQAFAGSPSKDRFSRSATDRAVVIATDPSALLGASQRPAETSGEQSAPQASAEDSLAMRKASRAVAAATPALIEDTISNGGGALASEAPSTGRLDGIAKLLGGEVGIGAIAFDCACGLSTALCVTGTMVYAR